MGRDGHGDDVHELAEGRPSHVLTMRQRRVLEVIRNAIRDRGYPPSMREIGERAGLASPSSVAPSPSPKSRGFTTISELSPFSLTQTRFAPRIENSSIARPSPTSPQTDHARFLPNFPRISAYTGGSSGSNAPSS